jgi:two-component system chemotaxis sensor kinase CheA
MSHGFDQEIVREFLTESGELLQQFESDLVLLEATPSDPDLLNRAFRALHTVKGSGSFLALTNLVTIAHAAESALNAARNGQVVVDRAMMDLLLKAVDTLKTHLGQLERGNALDVPDPEVVAALAAIGEGRQPSAGDAHHAPARASTDAVPAANAATQPPEHAVSQAAASGAHAPRPLTLGPGKSDLLGFLIADVDETVAKIRESLTRLAAETSLASSPAAQASGELAEHAEALGRNAEFFEFELMGRIAKTLARFGHGAPALPAEAHAQLCPRIALMATGVGYLCDGLRVSEVRSFELGRLLDRVEEWIAGTPIDPSSMLVPKADALAAARVDGTFIPGFVSPESSESTIATTPVAAASTPAQASDHASAAPSEAPRAAAVQASTPSGTPAAKDSGSKATATENTVRVEVARLEALMNLVGELVLQKNRVGGISRRLAGNAKNDTDMLRQLGLTAAALDRVTGDLQTAVMRTRMQPLERLFGRYPRLIRDLSSRTGKQIRLVQEGGETEVDKSVIEELGDPLVHLLRNACDHGLEGPDERRAAGKDPTGTITLRAMQEGGAVRVLIQDDGRGLSRERIGKKAVERGIVTAETLAGMPDRDVFRFIFEPGFSTAEQVSDLSGRGVGMDVVRTNVEKLRGSIDLSSQPGKGATVSITIPLTVAVLPAMLVGVGEEIYAVPLNSIIEIVRPASDQLKSIGGSKVMRLRDTVLPLISASEVMGSDASQREEPFAVVLQSNDRRAGLMVTRVIGQQEVVVKALDGSGVPTGARTAVSGATVRDDGGVSLIVDVAEVVRASEQRVERVAA